MKQTVERATATDLVVSCTPEKGDLRGFNYKFVYDVHSKALTGQVEYQPFPMPRLFVSGETPVLVGSDRKRMIALQFDALNDQIPFHLLKGPMAERWTERVNAAFGVRGFESGSERPSTYPRGPSGRSILVRSARFALIRNESLIPNTPASGFKIIERLGRRTKAYPLPRTTYDEFARLRPGRVRDGYQRQVTELAEEIGPAQVLRWHALVCEDILRQRGVNRSWWIRLFRYRKQRGTKSTPHLTSLTGPRPRCWLNPKPSGLL